MSFFKVVVDDFVCDDGNGMLVVLGWFFLRMLK